MSGVSLHTSFLANNIADKRWQKDGDKVSWDKNLGLFYHKSYGYYYDPKEGLWYDPETGLWNDPQRSDWFRLEDRQVRDYESPAEKVVLYEDQFGQFSAEDGAPVYQDEEGFFR